jgi:ubiquinone/menaquinone biosynthesis C-methylase UbiE
MSVLDVGSGVGGPARLLAATYGCQVTGVDLSEPFVDAARYLAERTGLSGQVSFETASALELPFDDGPFGVVLLQHVAMNISDRARLYREIRRVLKPGGRFATFDVVLNGGEPHYPVPWARTRRQAFSCRPPRPAKPSNRPASARWSGETTPRLRRPGSPNCARRGRRLRRI